MKSSEELYHLKEKYHQSFRIRLYFLFPFETKKLENFIKQCTRIYWDTKSTLRYIESECENKKDISGSAEISSNQSSIEKQCIPLKIRVNSIT